MVAGPVRPRRWGKNDRPPHLLGRSVGRGREDRFLVEGRDSSRDDGGTCLGLGALALQRSGNGERLSPPIRRRLGRDGPRATMMKRSKR